MHSITVYRWQFTVLGFITFLSLLHVFFGSSLPDNFLTIDDSTHFINPILYYGSSLLAYIGYFLGSWVSFVFITFFALYVIVLKNRDGIKNYFVAPLLLAFYLILFSLFFPNKLGDGLSFLVTNNLSTEAMIISLIVLFFSLMFIILSGSLNEAQHILKNITIKSYELSKKGLISSKNILFKAQRDIRDADLLAKAGDILKRDNKEQVKQIEHVPRVEAELIEEDNFNEVNEIPAEHIATEVLSEEKDITDNSTQTELHIPKARKPKAGTFFKSNDLINCISNKENQIEIEGPDQKYFHEIIKAIEEKLAEFKIEAKVVNILKGPVVDTFELDLGAGIKVSKVLNLADDLGLALNGIPLRIVSQMVGKSTLGIEVPRNPREIIYLDEVLKSKAYQQSNKKLPVAMGKDAFGETFVVDLASMPHMLVAGATGAGKSVFVNTLLVSLIVKKSPEDMKLILIDPKQLELALYQDLPHLIMPVVTDPGRSSLALLWAVEEMERRYTILRESGVKNIEGYNNKLERNFNGLVPKIQQYFEGDDDSYKLPYIVVIVDEFADLMLTKDGKEIEKNISRLAAKARAAGIHIVLATQRPSTDVITGVIKANFPTRVAFRVTSNMDSRVVLDTQGAEKLLGKGDMLYKYGADFRRLHSAYVDEDEIEPLVAKLSVLGQNFNEKAVDFIENEGDEGSEGFAAGPGLSQDELYNDAVQIVIESRAASASMLQRRLRVGYNRAANLIDELERNGVVGPAQGSKPRQILVSSTE